MGVALKAVSKLQYLEDKTIEFVDAFYSSDIPEEVIEAALFNIRASLKTPC